jgi:hypothetical protein
MRNEYAREALDFLEREQGGVREKLVILIEHFAWHAVHAAKVAAICHGNAQIPQWARERVREQPGRRCRGAGEIRDRADIGERNDASGHDDSGLGSAASALFE